MTITNPILPGFYPDPSLLRVGSDYYLANSTFEWFGGVEIHHSRNLADWEFVCRPLDSVQHLDLKGNPASGGVWAPCLSYSDGRFWLIFTDVKSWNDGPFKDCHNYLTTSEFIEGPWSDPVYLNSSGFDPSLFHDVDGRKWLVNMEWDFRKPQPQSFTGILLQELDPRSLALVGPVKRIFGGTSIGLTEGPHLYRRDGWYYLIVAEGGTEYGHAVTVARSRNLEGPYEVSPSNPLLTSAGRSELPLQKSGHGSLCDTPDNRWFLAFLVGRPLPNRVDCVLGRETALAEIVWDNGWPILKSGGNYPLTQVAIEPELAPRMPEPPRLFDYHFCNRDFLKDFMTLRTPFDGGPFSLTHRPGWLRIHGLESPVSRHNQALLARRQTDFKFEVETTFEFEPESYQQMAGLIYRYDESNLYYLHVTKDELLQQKSLGLLVLDQEDATWVHTSEELRLGSGPISFRLEVNFSSARFFWKQDTGSWNAIGPELDAGKLSDEYGGLGFTGAFVGITCQDFLRHQGFADFQSFRYWR